MTPCSAPRLTIVSALLCSPRSPPPRLVRPVGFARGSLLVTTLLLFRCSDKCLHMKPARWAWDRKYRVIYLTRWTWSKCTRGFSVLVETCKTADADFPKKPALWQVFITQPSLRVLTEEEMVLNVSGGYLLIYVFACLLCVSNMSEWWNCFIKKFKKCTVIIV